MKYLKSLAKYILGIVLFTALMLGIQLILPQGQVSMTYNQAILVFGIGIILIAAALKFSFENQ